MEKISIKTPYITLGQLLKFCNIIQSGGEEKIYLANHKVKVNDEVEIRRGRKIYPLDRVEVEGRVLFISNS